MEETIEQSQNVLREEQQRFVQALQLPFRQAIELQRNAARSILSGLEVTETTQRMGIDMTRSMFQSYIDAFQAAADVGERQMQMGMPGSQSLQSQQPSPQGPPQTTAMNQQYGQGMPPQGQYGPPPQPPQQPPSEPYAQAPQAPHGQSPQPSPQGPPSEPYYRPPQQQPPQQQPPQPAQAQSPGQSERERKGEGAEPPEESQT